MGGGEDSDFLLVEAVDETKEEAGPSLGSSTETTEEVVSAGENGSVVGEPGIGEGPPSGTGEGQVDSPSDHEEIVALRQLLAKLEKALGEGGEGGAASLPSATTSFASASSRSATPAFTPLRTVDGHEVIFVQENVAVHPTSPSWRLGPIGGSLRLDKDGMNLLLTWVPYPLDDAMEEEDIYVQQQGRPMKEVPVSEFHSVRRFSPALGYHYIIIALKSGLALPPLYFHSGGIKAFLSSLRLYAALSRARDNKDVYLVNFVRDPLKTSLNQLGLPETVASSNWNNVRQNDSWLENEDGEPSGGDRSSSGPSSSTSQGQSQGNTSEENKDKSKQQKKPKKAPTPEDVALNVLETLSFVTRFARDATSHIIAGITEGEGPVSRTGGAFRDYQLSLPGRAVREDGGKGWSKGSKGNGILSRPSDSRPDQGESQHCERQLPMEIEEWRQHLDDEGRVKDPEALRKRIFRGGLEPSLRQEVWKFLLGYYSFSSTSAEREVLRHTKAEEYADLRHSWKGVSPEEAASREGFLDQLHAVNKDVTRTDPQLPFYEGENNPHVEMLRSILTTYSFYDVELGYCQGMCDLLSPILFVIRDEAEAFWCFVALMKRVGPNFHQNQNGMQLQLLTVGKMVQLLEPRLHAYLRDEDCLNYFFCFRWIFLQFKREFSYEEVMQLWDVLWSRHLSPHFHLYLCVAILKHQEPIIVEEQMDFETLLKFVNELSGKINMEASLVEAERLCVKASRILASV